MLLSHTGEDYIGPEYLEMPLSPPRIQQENGSFLIGSRLDLNCTSVLSYPPVYLQWLVNNREVSVPNVFEQLSWRSLNAPTIVFAKESLRVFGTSRHDF